MHHHHLHLFIAAALIIVVKASRAMKYRFLTLQMVESIVENGIINQTIFNNIMNLIR